ncbi:MAG: ornithine cyclodeaminase family protein [Alphaproteobacteria bacterium]|nr:ornithine cyclodeaminase family protein [Alphaproteobacteria bacterium]
MTLLLTGSDVARLLPMDRCIEAVEHAFRTLAAGKLPPPGVLATHVEGGGFHVKAAVLDGCYAAKINANFPANPERGLPTIQGVVLLSDAVDGRPLAIMDSIEITARRTAAATALAARHLARADARTATIIGCGRQAASQIEALMAVRPLTRLYAIDSVRERSERLAREMAGRFGVAAIAASDKHEALADSLICITCTSSRRPVLELSDVRPGTFVAAVGADNPDKSEIAPPLMAEAKVVADVLEQAAAIGDLRHAIAARAMTISDVHAELADVLSGRRPGRDSVDDITIFDSTGTAIQDVAAAALVYRRAAADGAARSVTIAA